MRLRKLRVAGMSGMPKRPMLATPTEERTYVRRLKARIHALEAVRDEAVALLAESMERWPSVMARAEKAEAERDEIDRSRKRFMDGIAAFQSMTGFDLENGARRLLQLSESEARAEKAEAALAEIDGRAVHAAWRDGMIAQGRIVERDLMAWDNLRDVDR